MEEKQPRSFVTREAGALPAYLMGRHGRPRVVDNARRARTGVANRFEGNLRLDISGDEDEVEKANAAARGDPEPATHFAKDKEPAANDEVKKSKNRRRRKKKKAAGGPSTRWWISRAVALCAAVPLLYLVYAVVSANDEVKKSKNRRRRKKKKAAGGPSTRWWISRAVALCAAVPLLYLVYAVVSGFPSSTEAAKLL